MVRKACFTEYNEFVKNNPNLRSTSSNPPESVLVTSEHTNEIQGGYRNSTACPTPDSISFSNVGQLGIGDSELVPSNSQGINVQTASRDSDATFLSEIVTDGASGGYPNGHAAGKEPKTISARDRLDNPEHMSPVKLGSTPKPSHDRSIIRYKPSGEAKETSLSEVVGLHLTASSNADGKQRPRQGATERKKAESNLRRLAQRQHKERFVPSKFESENRFHSGIENPRWQVEEAAFTKQYCNPRMCLIQADGGKLLGTGSHFGQGFLLTCYHIIKHLYNGRIITSEHVIARFLDCNVSPTRIQIYQVCSELVFVNDYYDIAILRMNKAENKTYPPSFDIPVCPEEIKQEMTVFNVGYQIDDIECNPVLVVDNAFVLETPTYEFQQKLNKHMEDVFDDKTAFSGLLRPGNIILWSSIIDGGSGGLIIRLSSNTKRVELIGMYQNGFPKYFYDEDTSFTKKEDFDPKLKVESAICFSKIRSLLPDNVVSMM